jgi:hypothetical protein
LEVNLSPWGSISYLKGSSRLWSYGSWIYNYLCNQCLSPLKLWVQTHSWRGVLDTTLSDQVCQWLATGLWFSPVSSTNKTDWHDITEILLRVALNTINPNAHIYMPEIGLLKDHSCQSGSIWWSINVYTNLVVDTSLNQGALDLCIWFIWHYVVSV